jgi:tRNA-2-methylthio-N6-dimethylallyladenosine synthase
MNVNDTERMSVLLSDMGAVESETIQDADYVILNGCEVRDKAVQKMLSKLGELKSGKKKGKLIGVGGCVGQLDGPKLFSRNPHLDFVFGTDTIDHLPEIIGEVEGGARKVVYNDFDKGRDYSTETKVFHRSASAFVNIMKGCDKFCSYCIVPFTRGREKSRPIAEVAQDIKRLALLGVQEITLLGQNVNSYGKGNRETFPQLLRALDAEVPQLRRLRYTSSHPVDFSDDLIACYGEVRALCNQLHLPVQSGSNSVLARMYRHYKIEQYYEQIAKWRERCPDGGLSTDMIVGFPGETEEDFEATMKLLEDMRYDVVYSFSYSPRPGTKAYKLVDDIPDEVKHERLLRFQKRAIEIAAENNQKKVGRIMDVLVEGKNKPLKNSTSQNIFVGRTTCGRVVNFPYEGPRDLTGKFIDVKIERATGLALTGEMVIDAI